VAGADIRRFSFDRQGTSLNAPIAVIAAALFAFADAFLVPAIVLPVVTAQLTTNLTTVGLAVSLAGGLWFLPQVLSAGVIQDRRRIKPVVLLGGACRAAALGLFAYVGFRDDDFSNVQLLRWLIFALVVSTIASSFTIAPLNMLTVRSAHGEQRAGIFNIRAGLAGLLAIVAGIITARVFAEDGPGFPRSLTLIVLAAAACVAAATFLVGLVREPRRTAAVRTPTLGEGISGSLKSLGDRALRRFLLFRTAIAITAGFDALLILYGIEKLDIPVGYIGYYVAAFAAARFIADPLWSFVARTAGHRPLLQTASALRLIVPGIALAIPSIIDSDQWKENVSRDNASFILFGLTFVALGIASAGITRGSFGYLNEIVAPQRRFYAASLINFVLMLVAFLPVAIFALAKNRGLEDVITGGAIIGVLALLLSGALIDGSTTISRSAVRSIARRPRPAR
jgi:MFS family permease